MHLCSSSLGHEGALGNSESQLDEEKLSTHIRNSPNGTKLLTLTQSWLDEKVHDTILDRLIAGLRNAHAAEKAEASRRFMSLALNLRELNS